MIGPRGQLIKKISKEAKAELEQAFNCPIELLIQVRLRK